MQHFRDDSLKVKRYGQVFSGKLVGDLLVSMLPDDLTVRTVVDPMVGQGDLLQAAYAKYPQAENVTGIDIDADVIGICKKIFRKQRLLTMMPLGVNMLTLQADGIW